MPRIDFEYSFMRMPMAANMVDDNLIFIAANDRYCAAVQRNRDLMLGRYVFDVFPDTPERIKPVLEAYRKTLAGEITVLKSQPFKLLEADGTLSDRLWDVEHHPIPDAKGRITQIVQFCEDVTDRERLRQERDLISAELNHRVRNTLAVVQSVAEHTGAGHKDVDGFLESFAQRLESIDRNFTALSDAHWRGLKLEDILRTELIPFAGPALQRIKIDGPDIMISVDSTKYVTLVTHELVTNASKYGFLSRPTGRLDVTWRVEGNVLEIDWQESGLTGIKAPTRSGFGFELFDLIPGARLQRRFDSDGLKLKIVMPADIISDEEMVA